MGTTPCHCGLDPQSRGVGCAGEQDNTNHSGPSYWLQGSIHRAGHTTSNTTDPARHTGFKAVPTGRGGHATLSNYWLRPWRKLVLALRQYLQSKAHPNPYLSILIHVKSPTPQSTTPMQQNNSLKHNYPKNNCLNTLDITKYHVQLKLCLAEEKRTTPKPSPRKAGRG